MLNKLVDEKRIEEKFFLPKQKIYEFISLIRLLNAKKHYPDRKVQSLYLDYNNICFIDHIEGLFDRKKIRFRWYDDDHSNTVLEFKRKTSIFTTKKKRRVDKFSPNEKDVINLIKQKSFWEISSLLPSCYIFYNRSYYVLPNNEIRITIDDNLTYGTSNRFMKELDINSYIVEFKYSDLADIDQLYLVLKKLNLSLSKISKYIICKEQI
jgi:hypothetical protein